MSQFTPSVGDAGTSAINQALFVLFPFHIEHDYELLTRLEAKRLHEVPQDGHDCGHDCSQNFCELIARRSPFLGGTSISSSLFLGQ